ncbi:MAG: GH3 auxin-responsive promoter family protein [Chitinophagales bacterium]|nr:GH3 auxin-responsive promoter family protein [Chitinophagales bacterium]MDW8418083.1 GH3 auxin-responsive promoter family protein [Chitinophagales bacterium]
MGIRSAIAGKAAYFIARAVYRAQQQAVPLQQRLFSELVRVGAGTKFGRQRGITARMRVADFQKAVPVTDYEALTPYIQEIADGRPDVLWWGLPLYFCKSSGTTSGTKYIPVSKEQLAAMIRAARDALMLYVAKTGRSRFFDRKMIFLQGSPALEKYGAIPAGRLSGIVYHHVPFYARANRMPSYQVNCIEDWEEKITAIARETLPEPMSVISGIPPWVVMYFEKLRELSGKKFIKDIFPHFELFVYGGVNYEPYRQKIEELIGCNIPSVETYPASEGFIAYQDSQQQEGLLLNVNGGLFFEFVEPHQLDNPHPERLTLQDIETGKNYAVILTTNAGLWAYNLGDTVRFVSKNPYRLVVTGRVKHFISAFGEHVIAEEVEQAMQYAIRQTGCTVVEFSVAPQVNPPAGTAPHHEWWVEFGREPSDISRFSALLDEYMQNRNPYYRDLRQGNILQQARVISLPPGAFAAYMKSIGKLGGQNKVPRLKNDRSIAHTLEKMFIP